MVGFTKKKIISKFDGNCDCCLENGHEMENCWAFNMILNLSRNEKEFNYAI